jgi:hypothetical protein
VTTSKFNPVPHFCWLIAILLAIIAFLVLHVTNGDEVNSYISFASSLASLILAVVAIFYSMVSNDSISTSISSIQSLGSTVQKHADNFDNAATRFVAKVEEFTPHFSAIPSRIDAMSLDLQEKIQGIASYEKISGEQKPSASDGTSFFNRKVATGVNIATYMIAMSAKHNRSIDVRKLLPKDNVADYINGCLAVFEATSYKGVNIAVVNGSFNVLDTGEMVVERVIERASKKNDGIWKYVKHQIDLEFEIFASDQEADDDVE